MLNDYIWSNRFQVKGWRLWFAVFSWYAAQTKHHPNLPESTIKLSTTIKQIWGTCGCQHVFELKLLMIWRDSITNSNPNPQYLFMMTLLYIIKCGIMKFTIIIMSPTSFSWASGKLLIKCCFLGIQLADLVYWKSMKNAKSWKFKRQVEE